MSFRSLLAVSILLVCAGVSHAQVKQGDSVMWVNGGYAMGTSVITQESMDGASLMFAYEKRDWGQPVSMGFGIGYGELEENTDSLSVSTHRTYASVPMYFGAKYWLGKGKGQGYVGLMLGLYFSEMKSTVTREGGSTVTSTFGNNGAGLSIPAGAALTLSDSVLLNVNYTFNWLFDNDFLENDMLHVFNLGLGFRWGS